MSRYSIVFDNNCAICNLGVQSFRSLGLMTKENSIELQHYRKNNLACNVDPLLACDEMAVIDNETLAVQYGVDGYMLLLADKWPVLSKLLNNKLVKTLINPLYILLASNRRIIAPRELSETTCKPKLKKGYRLALMVLLGLFSAVITFQKGEILKGGDFFGFLDGYKLLQITGIGWLVTGLVYRRENKWDYWGHLSVIAGTAIFIQSLALIGYHIFPSIGWVISSMLVSDLLMLYMHYNRMKLLKMSQKYTVRWWLILHITAGLSVAQYYYF